MHNTEERQRFLTFPHSACSRLGQGQSNKLGLILSRLEAQYMGVDPDADITQSVNEILQVSLKTREQTMARREYLVREPRTRIH